VGNVLDSGLGLEQMDDIDDWYAVLGLAATMLFVLFFIVSSWLYHALMEVLLGKERSQARAGHRGNGFERRARKFWPRHGKDFSAGWSVDDSSGIGYLLAAFTAQKQALHDLMSSCLVLRRTR